MAYTPGVVAVVFDFDDTLVPDSTSLLLQQHGVDLARLWEHDVPDLVRRGFDPTLAWLTLFLRMVGPGKPLGELSRLDLRQFGSELTAQFYPGFPDILGGLRELVSDARDVSVEFYVVSSGLQDVIEGNEVISKEFAGVYACLLDSDIAEQSAVDAPIKHIRRAVTFTEKTRYLFEINKGVPVGDAAMNPLLVNKHVANADRRVPFGHMIYVGDGMTDVPCFSLVQKQGGTAFAVFDPTQDKEARRVFLDFLKQDRVTSAHAPRYEKDQELGALLRQAVAAKVAEIQLSYGAALSGS